MTERLVLSVDPGKATGVAYLSYVAGEENPRLVYSNEVEADEFAPLVRSLIVDFLNRKDAGDDVVLSVVCERFTINAQTVRNSQAPYSLEQIGVLKQILRDYGIGADNIYWQSPADAKAMFPNPAIKKVGVWHRGGEGHALDAIRHGLLHTARNGWKPTALLS